METADIVALAVGAFFVGLAIGVHLPQPEYAKGMNAALRERWKAWRKK